MTEEGSAPSADGTRKAERSFTWLRIPPERWWKCLCIWELDPVHLPKSYRLLKAEAPEDLPVRTGARPELPGNWISNQVATRTVGDEWLASKSTVLLRAPSVIVPETFNVLLNPELAEAGRVQVLWYEEYPWDARLVK
jgi:hypothetical protein